MENPLESSHSPRKMLAHAREALAAKFHAAKLKHEAGQEEGSVEPSEEHLTAAHEVLTDLEEKIEEHVAETGDIAGFASPITHPDPEALAGAIDLLTHPEQQVLSKTPVATHKDGKEHELTFTVSRPMVGEGLWADTTAVLPAREWQKNGLHGTPTKVEHLVRYAPSPTNA